jgi:hypothetical protein
MLILFFFQPLPNFKDRSIQAKRDYNDEQRRHRKKTSLLPGKKWYDQQAYRAIAQALGRCIRHGADFGTVVLMDSRHCNDFARNDLPRWMRTNVRTLSMEEKDEGTSEHLVGGGYPGLAIELQRFFLLAPQQSQSVREQWKSDLATALKRQGQSKAISFDRTTGSWTPNSSSSQGENTQLTPPNDTQVITSQVSIPESPLVDVRSKPTLVKKEMPSSHPFNESQYNPPMDRPSLKQPNENQYKSPIIDLDDDSNESIASPLPDSPIAQLPVQFSQTSIAKGRALFLQVRAPKKELKAVTSKDLEDDVESLGSF